MSNFCSVCFLEITGNAEVFLPACQHPVHTSCMLQWVLQHGPCCAQCIEPQDQVLCKNVQRFRVAVYEWETWRKRQLATIEGLQSAAQVTSVKQQQHHQSIEEYRHQATDYYHSISTLEQILQENQTQARMRDNQISANETCEEYCTFLTDTYHQQCNKYQRLQERISTYKQQSHQLQQDCLEYKEWIIESEKACENVQNQRDRQQASLDDLRAKSEIELERIFGVKSASRQQMIRSTPTVQPGLCRYCEYTILPSQFYCPACTNLLFEQEPLNRLMHMFKRFQVSSQGRDTLYQYYQMFPHALEVHLKRIHLW